MYQVVNWDTNKVISEHADIKKARRACRGQGSIPSKEWEDEFCSTLMPVARVQDADGYCVYNPRFKNPSYTGS